MSSFRKSTRRPSRWKSARSATAPPRGAAGAGRAAPAAFLLGNFFEWGLHRWVMHVPRAAGRAIYERHTLTHHALFTPGRMAVASARELRWVLMPAAAFLGMLAAVAPVVA